MNNSYRELQPCFHILSSVQPHVGTLASYSLKEAKRVTFLYGLGGCSGHVPFGGFAPPLGLSSQSVGSLWGGGVVGRGNGQISR